MYLFQIWTAFRVFDKNGDGMVTKAEFRSVSSNSQSILRTAVSVLHPFLGGGGEKFFGGKKECLGSKEKILRR